MQKTIKKCLVLLLITSLAILPLRAAFAMPTMNTASDNTTMSDHCKDMNMDMSHDMSSMTDEDYTQINNDACCDKCDNDCNHCMSTVSFIETDTIQTLNHQSETFYRFSSTSVLTQAFSPPFRPPATLLI